MPQGYKDFLLRFKENVDASKLFQESLQEGLTQNAAEVMQVVFTTLQKLMENEPVNSSVVSGQIPWVHYDLHYDERNPELKIVFLEPLREFGDYQFLRYYVNELRRDGLSFSYLDDFTEICFKKDVDFTDSEVTFLKQRAASVVEKFCGVPHNIERDAAKRKQHLATAIRNCFAVNYARFGFKEPYEGLNSPEAFAELLKFLNRTDDIMMMQQQTPTPEGKNVAEERLTERGRE